jgi:hypothetical protein
MNNSNMNEIIKTLDDMLMIDVPIMCLISDPSALENFQPSRKKDAIIVIKGELFKVNTKNDSYRKELISEVEIVKNIYDKIEISRLTENTGKSTISSCKSLIDEYFNIMAPFHKMYIDNIPIEKVPNRAFDIVDNINSLAHKIEYLNAYKLYRQSLGHYFKSSQEGTRISWFLAGKPVEKHEDKLPYVLNRYRNLYKSKFTL